MPFGVSFSILKVGEYMNQKELQGLVEKISLEFFGMEFKHQALFNSRLQTTGGRYHSGTHDLDFNEKVLEVYGLKTFIGIIKHELCHYHLHLANRGYKHKDREFKYLLKSVDGLRFTPPLKKPKKTVHIWQYKCKRCQSIIQRQRRFNTQKYVCSKCSGSFELLD